MEFGFPIMDINGPPSDLQIISSAICHGDLLQSEENTALSGNGIPTSVYMLKYHQDRILAAIHDLPDAPTAMLDYIGGDKGLVRMRKGARSLAIRHAVKLRYTVDVNGVLDCTAADLGNGSHDFKKEDYFPTRFLNPAEVSEEQIKWLVTICPTPIEPSFKTRHKTTARDHYGQALKHAPEVKNGYRAEVLIMNNDGHIMEGCITTPYFYRESRWTTPDSSCGGNIGTTRRWALENGLAVEAIVPRASIQTNEIIVLSNGVRGFGYAKVVGKQDV